MAAATMYVTSAGAGLKDGTSWSNAMGEAEFETDLEGGAEAGDIYYIMEGTYTLDSAYDSSARDGTTYTPITLIGVTNDTTATPPALSDWSDANMTGGADDRPLFACAANGFKIGDFYKVFNISFTTTNASGVLAGASNVFVNCKAIQESTSDGRIGFNLGADNYAVYCEAVGFLDGSDLCGTPFRLNTSTCIFCYAHTGSIGYDHNAIRSRELFCIAEDLDDSGVYIHNSGALVMNCSINDCYQGINGSSAASSAFINNILEGSGYYGIGMDDNHGNLYWKNHGDDARNSDMWLLVATTMPHMDPYNSTGDPKFDGDSNLSLQSSSPCLNNGLSSILGT